MTVTPGTAVLERRLQSHLDVIYAERDVPALARELVETIGAAADSQPPPPDKNHWTESDVIAITYGDSIVRRGEAPLATLARFLEERLADVLGAVHILPFFPYSSDDGFSVIDYLRVDERLGTWDDVERIARRFKLMADLVVNHVSSRSLWFENFRRGLDPGRDYFMCGDPAADLSAVIRPRSSPLLTAVETAAGCRNVWCTFSADQVDLDFHNPQVLLEFVKIIRFYLERGVRIFRFDAVAFLWKEPGTCSLHLPQTHEIIKLLRVLIEHKQPDAIVITETNVPNRENLSYFGRGDEAHAIYNFSLPPLLLDALLHGTSRRLRAWIMGMPPARFGTAYFNFIASHDGIGLRPAEGLMSERELNSLIRTVRRFGGRVSMRRGPSGHDKPYELNISLFDALRGTATGGPDGLQVARFLSAHSIMMAIEGIPGFYIHSLLATENDYEKMRQTGQNRSLNRHTWDYDELNALLNLPTSPNARVFRELGRRIAIRRKQPAFHPNATQYTLHLGQRVFGVWRQSLNRVQSIFALNNVSDREQEISLEEINLIPTDDWVDLISGAKIESIDGTLTLAPYQSQWITNRF